jgi:hypothetical protein
MTSASNDITEEHHGDAGEAGLLRSPAVVASVGWLLPGGGYLLLRQKGRGITIGVTVVLLFVMGLLIGGVRVLEVPFFTRVGEVNNETFKHELQTKPWSIAQIMNGPVAIIGGVGSVYASVPRPDAPLGAESHARINDIAVLYTAVAGMLNLLAIIDSAYRASQLQEAQ